MFNLEKETENRYRIKKTGRMLVDAVIYSNEKLIKSIKGDLSLTQLTDAACLKGVIDPVIGMPDIHQGFGLPIGGIMAMDTDKGLISAGAVGMDINCGVRLMSTKIPSNEVKDKLKLRSLMNAILRRVPVGTGKRGTHELSDLPSLEAIAEKGSKAIVDKGFGYPEDIEKTEEYGCLHGGTLAHVSETAKKRGREQLGTLGGGNHFIDIQIIDEIYDKKTANIFKLAQGNIAAMIHSGSRGLGHQVCVDYTNILWEKAEELGIYIPQKGLAAAPINSKEGMNYFSAMAAAVNFAFSNRQMILFDVREAFKEIFAETKKNLGLDLVYDVAHNIAKYEEVKEREMLIHRKGATRALPSGHKLNPEMYMRTGHPVLIPGSMGTPSYVLIGTEKAEETYFSVNHGAGRVMARHKAHQELSPKIFEEKMKNILISERNYAKVIDESPMVYKDIDEVINILVEEGLCKKIARLKPIGVIIGIE